MFLSYFRTVLLYLVLIAIIRLMGKRQVGQMEPSEFVVTMLIANLAAIPMQDSAVPLYTGIIPLLTILGLELILSALSLRSMFLRRLFCGKPVILIENGNILQENLRKTRITLDELTGHLRQKDVLDPRAVQYAILETNGELSVFPFPKERPASARDAGIRARPQHLPITVISDGHLLKKNLLLAGKDTQWLKKTLSAHNARQETTWLLTVDQQGNVIYYPKEDRP